MRFGTEIQARLIAWLERFLLQLGTQVDGASLAIFRMVMGAAMVYEAISALLPSILGHSRAFYFYVKPGYNFTYEFFSWAHPLPEPWIYVHIGLFGFLGLFLALGLFYRAASIGVALLFTWFFLLEESLYLNHHYLISLFAWILVVVPAHRCWSLDAWRKERRGIRLPASVPFWTVFLLRFHMFILYFYAGIAKLHYDWLAGHVMGPRGGMISEWLGSLLNRDLSEATLLGPQFMALFLSWGGTVFDLAVPFLFLWSRTRWIALGLTLFFHTTNHFVFNIGVFPFLGFAASLMFFPVDWPRRLGAFLQRTWAKLRQQPSRKRKPAPDLGAMPAPIPPLTRNLLYLWLAFHILFPFRHVFIPGNATWTNEGHRFAWRMMLHRALGSARFDVVDPTILTTGEEASQDLNWDKLPEGVPSVEYAEFDADLVDLDQMPEFFVLFEPVVGERMVWNPRRDDRKDTEAVETRIREHWKRTYGREPEVSRPVSLPEALQRIEAALESLPDRNGNPQTADLHSHLQEAKKIAAALPRLGPHPGQRAIHLLELDAFLRHLAQDPAVGKTVTAHLRLVPPLYLLTGRKTPDTFLVFDEALQNRSTEHQTATVNWEQWQDPKRVFVDLRKMSIYAFRNLPLVMVTRNGQQARLEWNLHAELVKRQVDRLARRPYLIHQYCQRIRRWWVDHTGREPEIYVTALVNLNQHPTQPLVDPQVDLTKVKKWHLRKNPWILDLHEAQALAEGDEDPLLLADQEGLPDVIPRRQRGDLRDGRLINSITRWYPQGTKEEEREFQIRNGREFGTLSAWYEDGQIRLRAGFIDDDYHGKVEQWHPNGTLAIEAYYKHGTKDGPVRMWNEEGTLEIDAAYVDGELKVE